MKTHIQTTYDVKSKPFRSRIGQVPTSLAGLALAIASLAGAWGLLIPTQAQLFLLLLTPVALSLVGLVILKYAFNPSLIHEDLSHQLVSSVMPTVAMATMVISANLSHWLPSFSRALWVTALFTHMVLFVAFIHYRIKDFHISNMVPSWFIPPIGIVVSCVTSPAVNFTHMVKPLFVFGISSYGILLPLMFYRLVFHERIPEIAKPTFAIMAAPASMTLAGYLTISKEPNLFLVATLTPIAILMTMTVWVAMVRLMRLRFSPSFTSFTFPMVIGAIALLKLENLLSSLPNGTLPDYPQKFLHNLAILELIVATCVVLYVGWCFFQRLISDEAE